MLQKKSNKVKKLMKFKMIKIRDKREKYRGNNNLPEN